MLENVRVIDLTQQDGTMCGQILADLGADVVQIEPPGGAAGRLCAPFLGGKPDPELSLSWAAYARGKRSAVLDLDTPDGLAALKRLIGRADVLIESERPGRMKALGLTDAALDALNARLIHASITGFGRTGPKANWAWSDLVVLAAGGPLLLNGDSDRPPVRISVPQAFGHAGAEAAVGVMLALHERHMSGLGQHVEVSAQEAITIATQSNIVSSGLGDATLGRGAGIIAVRGFQFRSIWPAADGYVALPLLFGPVFGIAIQRLMDCVCEAGFCDGATRAKDWINYGTLLDAGAELAEEFARVNACIGAFARSKTKAELLALAMERRVLVAPVANIADNVDGPQAASRDFFVRPKPGGRLSELRYPGPFAKFSKSPIGESLAPPRLGEHTDDVLRELADQPSAPKPAARASDDRPLAGVKILDFTWAIAGPASMRTLADFGATVVRVESAKRFDPARTVGPYVGGVADPNHAAVFHNFNTGKNLLSLDLTHPASKDIVHDLVRWADVVCESFSPRAMKAFGYDYGNLVKLNPDLVMLSTTLMGQNGPLSMFAGYGNLAASIAGFFDLTGWPDRPPAGPYGAYTDYISPRFNAICVLAALQHRRRTGEGQYIDMSQLEANMRLLAPVVLDYTGNGHIQTRRGNDDFDMAPHGVYPAEGEDAWVAIACTDDAAWGALCGVVDTLGPLQARFAKAADRLADRELLDKALSRWTSERTAQDAETALQAAGVAASAVQHSRELMTDPQLKHMGRFRHLPHATGGDWIVENSAIHLSRTPGQTSERLPVLGCDTETVLSQMLGYDADKIAGLRASGALQ